MSSRARRRVLVIWNPLAGGASPDEPTNPRADDLRAALASGGLEAELFESRSEAATATRVSAALNENWEAIVAAGGDGTVHCVARQLIDREMALGILPMGTAMNIARSLDVPLELEAAIELLAQGPCRPIDVGVVRGVPFLEIVSIGLGAEVLAGATDLDRGRWRAAFALLRRAARNRRTRIELEMDGRRTRARALGLIVANGAFTGRGLELAPDARIDDGELDVLVFRGLGPVRLALHLLWTLVGRVDDARVRSYRGRRILVSSQRPLPVRADSIDRGVTPVDLVVKPGALRVIAPDR